MGTRSLSVCSRMTTSATALRPSGSWVPAGCSVWMVTGYVTTPCSDSPNAAMSEMVPMRGSSPRASSSTDAGSSTCRKRTSTSSTVPEISTMEGSAMTIAVVSGLAVWPSSTGMLAITPSNGAVICVPWVAAIAVASSSREVATSARRRATVAGSGLMRAFRSSSSADRFALATMTS